MATKNINVSPYYDDFDASKNYHKILFRPTFSVQARELTQLQTILQDQISKGTDAILENGNNLVPGEIILRRDISYVTLSTDTTGFNTNITLANLPGKTIENSTGYIKAKVIAVSDLTTTESLTLFVSYLNSYGGVDTFSDTETLREDGTNYAVGTVGTYTGLTAPTAGITGTGSVAQVGGGVYYINGHMVNVTAQALVLDKYTTTPTYRIGFTVGESFVDNSTDSALNDNAQGTTNYLAPGAHRYKIALSLAKRTLTDTVSANNKGFVEVCRVVSGVIQKHDNFVESLVTDLKYNDRDYNENGNYIVDDFDIEIREYSSTLSDKNGLVGRNTPTAGAQTTTYESDLEIGIGVGSAVINGKSVTKNDKTWLKVDKSRESTDLIKIPSSSTNADIGNYVGTNVLGETIDRKYSSITGKAEATQETGFTYGNSNGGYGAMWGGATEITSTESAIFQFANSSVTPYQLVILGEIHTTQQEGMWGTTTEEFESEAEHGQQGNRYAIKRATARIRDIRKDPKRPGEFRIYLFDITVDEGEDLSGVDCIAIDSGTTTIVGTSNPTIYGYPKIICQLDSETLTTSDSGKNTAVYEIPQKNISSIAGVEISEVRRTITASPSSNTITFQTSGDDYLVVDQEDDGGSVKQSSLDNVLVFGDPRVANRTYPTMMTSDSLDVTFNTTTKQSATISAATGAVGIFSLKNASFNQNSGVSEFAGLHSQAGKAKKLEHGDIFRIHRANRKYEGCVVQYVYSGTDLNGGINEYGAWRILNPGKNITNATVTSSGNELFVEVISAKYPEQATLDHYTFGDDTPRQNFQFSDTNSNIGADGYINSLELDDSSSYHVIYSVKKGVQSGDAGRAAKTLVYTTEYITGSIKVNNLNFSYVGDEYVLESTDVHPKEGTWKVEMATDYNNGSQSAIFPRDITNRYTLDTGQRDEYYGRAKLILKANQPKPTGNLKITFWKFTHGNGDYFSIGSYPTTGQTFTDANTISWGNFSLSDIPSFIDSSGKTYKLGDCVDFRATKSHLQVTSNEAGGTAFSSAGSETGKFIELPANNATITINSGATDDVQFYGGRVDKIVLDDNGNFSVVKGPAYDKEVTIPEDLEGEMSLYSLRLLPYVYTTDDVYAEKVDNKRYTMSDLKDIDKRVEQLELYNTLSPLEIEAKDFNHGDVDFTNAFWVDSFLGHDKGDPVNVDYSCAVDANNKELRASFYQEGVAHSMDTTLSANNMSTLFNINEATNSSLITLKKKTTDGDVGEFINLETDTTDSIRSHPAGTHYGYMSLSPFFDNWKSTNSRPDVVFDKKKYFNSIKSIPDAELTQGTIWSDWKHHWTGSNINDSKVDVVTDTGLESNNMSEFETNKGFSIVSEKRGTREIAKNYYPYIRSKTITITVSGLKPATETVQVYFDGVEVTTDVTVAATYGVSGTTYKTDSSGKFVGTYIIPNVDDGVGTTKFRVGRKVVKVTANESEAQAVYNVSGYVDDIGMTNVAEFSQPEQVAEILGQELIVDEDCFISKIDLYFSAEDTTLPVVVQLREMDAGKPTGKVLPYSTKVLTPADISTTAATTVTYSDYIFLKSGRYCLSLHSTSDEYSVYTLNTDAAVGSKPINIGNMYRGTKKVTNKTLKFQAYRADFSITESADQVVFNVGVNADRTLDPKSIYTNSDDVLSKKYMRVYMDAHGYQVDDEVTFNGFLGNYVQILNFGDGLGNGGTVNNGNSTFVAGEIVSTVSGALDGDEPKRGTVIKFDTSGDFLLHIALEGDTLFETTDTIYDDESLGIGSGHSIESPTGTVNGIPIAELNYSANTGNTFNVESVDFDNFVVERKAADISTSYHGFYEKSLQLDSSVETLVVRVAKRRVDLIHHAVEQIVPKGTAVTWEYSTDNTTYNPIVINDTDRLLATEFLSSNIYLRASFTSTNSRVSPVVDVNTIQSILIANRLNDKTPSIGSTLRDGNNIIDRWRIFDPPVVGTSNGSRIDIYLDSSQTVPYTQGYLTPSAEETSGTYTQQNVDGEILNRIQKGDYLDITLGAGSYLNTQVVYVYDVQSRATTSPAVIKVYFRTINGVPIFRGVNWPDGISSNQVISEALSGTGAGVGLDIYTGFIEEYWPDSSSTMSNYVGKKVNLKYAANSLKIVADAQIPQNTNVEVWVKTSTTGREKDFDKLEYVQCPLVRYGLLGAYNELTPVSNDGKFHEAEYLVTDLPVFTTAQVKLVFKGTETIDSPRIKNLKVFALTKK